MRQKFIFEVVRTTLDGTLKTLAVTHSLMFAKKIELYYKKFYSKVQIIRYDFPAGSYRLFCFTNSFYPTK